MNSIGSDFTLKSLFFQHNLIVTLKSKFSISQFFSLQKQELSCEAAETNFVGVGLECTDERQALEFLGQAPRDAHLRP